MIDINKVPGDGIRPFGEKISISYRQLAIFLYLIEQFRPQLFMELGFLEGGFGSVVYASRFRTVSNYIGFDVEKGHLSHNLEDVGLFYYQIDLQDPASLGTVLEKWNFHSGCRFLFLDNGNKKKEIKMYHPLISLGDILIVHDYGTEVDDSDIEFLLSKGFEILNDPEEDLMIVARLQE